MQKLLFFFLFIGSTMFAQIPKGYCKPTKVSPDKTSQSKITFKFVNPQGKPATSHVAFKINGDKIVQPEIDKAGIYEMTLEPGTYSFNFFVKFWYDIDSKPLVLKPKTNTFVTVKFEAVEIGSTPVK
jgi:hypothetical protein